MPVFTLTRISTSAAGAQGPGFSGEASFSDDGTRVVFTSSSPNLVAGDVNNQQDIFVKTLATGAIELVNITGGGAQTNDQSNAGDFTPDGTRVVFQTASTGLGYADGNSNVDVFIKTIGGGLVLLSETGGVAGNGASAFTRGGAANNFVAFETLATDLTAGDANAAYDVVRRNLTSGVIDLVSASQAGVRGNQASQGASISADGARIAFQSSATNLIGADANGFGDIFVKDMGTGAVTLVSVAADGTTQGNQVSDTAQISADGTKVVFRSSATNLVAGDTNGLGDIFVKTLATGAIERVSVSTAGVQANDVSDQAVFSADGRYVAFYSSASNLVAGDTNAGTDIFIRDLVLGTTERVSTQAGGTQGTGGDAFYPSIGPNQLVAFTSSMTNLVAGDSNGQMDIFVAGLQAAAPVDDLPDPHDYVAGGNDNDTIQTGIADDILVGNGGDDSLWGESGNDSLLGGPGIDTLHGGTGNDTGYGETGNDSLQGNAGKDLLDGGPGADSLYGGRDADSVYGGAGDDLINGDMGNDLLWGGAGADRFVFQLFAGLDWIADFNFAEGDRIQIPTGSAYGIHMHQGQVVLVLQGGIHIGLVGIGTFSSDWLVFG